VRSSAGPLHGSRSYSVTFPPHDLPPVSGFWSLTLYNEHHSFHPNELGPGQSGQRARVASTLSATMARRRYTECANRVYGARQKHTTIVARWAIRIGP
jgi:Protein of unknown function (DUF1214)